MMSKADFNKQSGRSSVKPEVLNTRLAPQDNSLYSVTPYGTEREVANIIMPTTDVSLPNIPRVLANKTHFVGPKQHKFGFTRGVSNEDNKISQLSIANSSVQFAPTNKNFPMMGSNYLRTNSGELLSLAEPSVD